MIEIKGNDVPVVASDEDDEGICVKTVKKVGEMLDLKLSVVEARLRERFLAEFSD